MAETQATTQQPDSADSRHHASPPFVYLDHNFVVVAHDAGATYGDWLRQLVSDKKLKFVLSTWHWLEMARDTDHVRGLSAVAFADSLSPAWLFERLTIQQREVEDAFFLS